MRFSLIYRTWAFQIVHAIGPLGKRTGLPFWADARGPGISLGLPFPWAWRVGLRVYFLNPISCPPTLGYGVSRPNPGPTRLADPNRFPGRETQDWDSLPDFFFQRRTGTCGYGLHLITGSQYHIHLPSPIYI